MRILFTGASSFTGYWFVQALADRGHQVVATYSSRADKYQGVRSDRVEGLANVCEQVFGCVFGTDAFFALLDRQGPFDVLAHHAADVTNYRSDDFDVMAALQANTLNLKEVLRKLEGSGCRRIALTGSVFEPGEGQGSQGLPAFSPYGLSKALTAETFEYYAKKTGLHLGKFIIPNPFGPLEEPRFTAYLIDQWRKGQIAEVRTPAYVRDNIHIDLLAACYAGFIASLPDTPTVSRISPSGYIESQGAFAWRFAKEISVRSGWSCDLDLADQLEFDEPRVRVNIDPGLQLEPQWQEAFAWDALWAYYERKADLRD